MSRLKKTVSLILGLLLLILFLAVFIGTKSTVTFPAPFQWLNQDLELPYDWRFTLYQTLFWLACGFLILTVVALLAIIFFPRQYSELELAKDKGTLKISASAIKGYVSSLVTNGRWMADPAVAVKLYKKRFKVEVAGNWLPLTDATSAAQQLEKEIEDGLKRFFGLEQKLDFTVKVKEIDVAASTNKKANQPRVQ